MKRKLSIIPFTKVNYPLITCEPTDFEISAVIAPHGVGIEGNDISVLRNREQIGLYGSSNLSKGYDSCDVVLIPDVGHLSNRGDDSKLVNRTTIIRDYTINALEEAIEHRKDILCFSSMDIEDQKKYLHSCESKGIKFQYYDRTRIDTIMSNKLREISVPVVFVGETSHDCDGYEIFLKLIQSFNADKKKVLALSEDKYNALYKQYSVTFWNHNDPMQNVINIKNYVARLADETKPDVILIKLPEPMTKFDDDITYDFGMTAFLLSQALPVSYMIYCSLYSLLNPQLMSNLSESFMAKYGYPISAVHISNQITDFREDDKDTMQTAFIDFKSNMKDIRNETDIPFYNLNNTDDYNKFYETLYDELFEIPYGVIAL